MKANRNRDQGSIIKFLQPINHQPQSSTIQTRKQLLCERLEAELSEPEVSEAQNSLLLEREKEISSLKSKNNEKDSNIKALTKALDKAYKLIGQKEIAYQELLNQKTAQNNNQYYCHFEQLNGKTLADLRSISSGKKNDLSFVRCIVRSLYEDDLNILTQRTAAKKTNSKNPITPQKKEIIASIFEERLTMEKITSIEKIRRESNLNKLIKDAIQNIITNKKK